MIKKILLCTVYILAFAVTVFNLVYSIRGSVFSDINDLPKGDYVLSVASPDEKSTIKMYKIDNSIGKGVRCELKKGDKTRNIFWQTGITESAIIWQSNEVVDINGVLLNVTNNYSYDCRRGVSLFQEGAIEGNEAEAVKENGQK